MVPVEIKGSSSFVKPGIQMLANNLLYAAQKSDHYFWSQHECLGKEIRNLDFLSAMRMSRVAK